MQTMKRLVIVTTLALFCAATANGFQKGGSGGADASPDQDAKRPAVDQSNYRAKVLANPLVEPPKRGLVARKPMPKRPVTKPVRATNLLIVKFGDPVVGPAAVRNGRLTLKAPFRDFEAQLDQMADRFNVTFRQAVPHGQIKLEKLYQQAERNSGRMQPNLKSYMYVEGDMASLQAVATELINMRIVELVEWHEDMRPSTGGDPIGSCCLPDDSCTEVTEADCLAMAGTYNGDFTDCAPNPCNAGACCYPGELGFECAEVSADSCNNDLNGYFQGAGEVCINMDDEFICDDLNPECGEDSAGSCFWTDGENGTPFCSNNDCCELICDQDPFCCDEGEGRWDEFCAAIANQICATPPADRCNTPLNGNCTEPNSAGGCNNATCCNTVCGLDPTCCNSTWDDLCVELARENCATIEDRDDYTSLQGYRDRDAYNFAKIPEHLVALLPVTDGGQIYNGFGGQGWHLFDPTDPHEGMYGIGQELLDVYGVDEYGDGVLTRGKSINVAVIEWGYWGPEPFEDDNDNGEYDDGESFSDVNDNGIWDEGHEDLDVIPEPGQTLILNPQIAENDHGTACLGIINGKENGFGVTGIAPDAQAYFFPLTSVEEGPRPLAAWTSALNTLLPGDVISASYGPGPEVGNLNNSLFMWPIIRLASDLGITVCIAAGNACYNLDDAPDLGDSGAMVVGACSPGFPWYRLIFSNYCTDPGPVLPGGVIERSNIVHIKAWGTGVATCGYGDLSLPDGDRWRSYTVSFGGTSAAAPQIAGLAACLQGLAKQFYGITLTPEQIRVALGAPGIPPPLPAPRLFGGFDDSVDCSLDLDGTAGPHMIGPYPVAAGDFGSAASTILNQGFAGFDDSPLVEEVIVLHGDKVYGNHFSVKGSDDNYLVINSLPANLNGPSVPDTLPAGVTAGQIEKARYLAEGQTVDILVTGRSPVANVSDMTIVTEYQPPPGIISLFVVEAYDWFSKQWIFIGVTVWTGTEGEIALGFNVPGAYRFVRAQDRMIMFRLYGVSFGNSFIPSFGGGGTGRKTRFIERVDWLDVQVQEGFAAPLPIPPNLF